MAARRKRTDIPLSDEFERRYRADQLVKCLTGVLYELNNRVRVLEGLQAVNKAAFRAALKAKFENPNGT